MEIKPNPFLSLNHLTVPVDILLSSFFLHKNIIKKKPQGCYLVAIILHFSYNTIIQIQPHCLSVDLYQILNFKAREIIIYWLKIDLLPIHCTTFKVSVCVHTGTGSWSVAETVCIASTVSGAGGKYPSALCGRSVLYSLRHLSINTFASNNVSNISPFRSSSRSFPLKPD